MGAPRTRGPRDGQKPHNELSHRDLFSSRVFYIRTKTVTLGPMFEQPSLVLLNKLELDWEELTLSARSADSQGIPSATAFTLKVTCADFKNKHEKTCFFEKGQFFFKKNCPFC